MSWALPSALVIAGIAAVAIIALHFIARSRPLAEPLPTTRFIPHRPVHARTRSMALSDVLLMLLRIAAVLILGAAAAGPIVTRHRGGIARVLVVDRSRDVASMTEVSDSVRSLSRGAEVVYFDSAAQTSSATTLDSLETTHAPGSLSVALAAGIAAGSRVTARDSVELAIVSPFAMEEFDAGTAAIRAAWPGRVRLVRVASAPTDTSAIHVQVFNDASDPVVAALSLAHAVSSTATVRLRRRRLSAEDSAWARDSGHVLVHWPFADTAAIWPKRARIDAIGAVTSDGGTVVGRFPRLWEVRGRAIAFWADGEVAAAEHAVGDGCIRDVGVLLDPASDLTLHAPFRAFMAAIFAPCGGARRSTPADAATLARLAGSGPLAPVDALKERADRASRWTPWLLALAAALLILELAVRRARGTTA